MIHVRNLTKKFGRFTAVDDLSFDVAAGEALALWGPNGAGKTTAIRCILGLLRGRGGITVAGHDIRRRGRAARRAMGYVPQELAFYDDLRLRESLRFFARLKAAPRDRIGVVLDEVGLGAHGRKRVRELSGGMKQRLALALALLADPPVLVLDELTSNLDAAAQAGFMSLLRGLRQSGKTILFTSHRLEEVEHLADRVLVMEGGRRKLVCRPDEVAEAVGVRCILKVIVDDRVLDAAVEALVQRGFAASRNGAGVFVEVGPQDKAAPIHALAEERITVRSFEFADDEPRRRAEEVRS